VAGEHIALGGAQVEFHCEPCRALMVRCGNRLNSLGL
jgi:hypothetical protein